MDSKDYVVTPASPVSDIDLDTEEFRLGGGSRLAEQRAAEAETAEANRTRQIENLKLGRKSLTGEGQHSPLLQVRLPHDLDSRVDDIAADQNVSASAIARRALGQYPAAYP